MISVCCVQISVQVAGLAEMQMALFNAKVALRQMTFIQTAPIVFPVVLMSFPKIVKCVRTMLIKVAITADIAIYVMKVLHQSITTLNFALHAIPNCKSCNGFSNSCNKCNDGYSWDGNSGSCLACNLTNCSSCSAGNCDVCNSGSFKNGTGHCVKCSDYGTIVSNCIEPSCYNSSNVITQQCPQCNSSYYPDSNLATCSKCSDILSNCISCYYSWSHLIESGYHLCSKCDPGYYLQFLTDNITYVCTQNCSSKHIFDSTLKMCIPCTQLFGNGCSSCNKTQCLSCDSKFYNLVHPEANSTCSQCTNQIETIVTVSNVSLCLRRSDANISNFTASNKSATLNVNCSIANSKVYFVYGPASSLQSVTLTMIQAKVGSFNNTNIPSTADTLWIGYGVRTQNGTQSTNITLIPPLKKAGDKYRLTVWCQSAVNKSDVSSVSQDWTQPNNGGQKTKISFATNATLNSSQKKSLGIAVRKTLQITRDIYTDDGILVPETMDNLGNSRILQEARILVNNNTVSFAFCLITLQTLTKHHHSSIKHY